MPADDHAITLPNERNGNEFTMAAEDGSAEDGFADNDNTPGGSQPRRATETQAHNQPGTAAQAEGYDDSTARADDRAPQTDAFLAEPRRGQTAAVEAAIMAATRARTADEHMRAARELERQDRVETLLMTQCGQFQSQLVDAGAEDPSQGLPEPTTLGEWQERKSLFLRAKAAHSAKNANTRDIRAFEAATKTNVAKWFAKEQMQDMATFDPVERATALRVLYKMATSGLLKADSLLNDPTAMQTFLKKLAGPSRAVSVTTFPAPAQSEDLFKYIVRFFISFDLFPQAAGLTQVASARDQMVKELTRSSILEDEWDTWVTTATNQIRFIQFLEDASDTAANKGWLAIEPPRQDSEVTRRYTLKTALQLLQGRLGTFVAQEYRTLQQEGTVNEPLEGLKHVLLTGAALAQVQADAASSTSSAQEAKIHQLSKEISSLKAAHTADENTMELREQLQTLYHDISGLKAAQLAGQESAKLNQLVARGTSTGQVRCFSCGEKGHVAALCSKGLTCFSCGASGHTAAACTSTRKVCQYCKARGHTIQDCQEAKQTPCKFMRGGRCTYSGGRCSFNHDGSPGKMGFSRQAAQQVRRQHTDNANQRQRQSLVQHARGQGAIHNDRLPQMEPTLETARLREQLQRADERATQARREAAESAARAEKAEAARQQDISNQAATLLQDVLKKSTPTAPTKTVTFDTSAEQAAALVKLIRQRNDGAQE